MQINGETQLIGLIGWPVAHSLSPLMHNTAAHELDLNWTYVPLPVHPDEVGMALQGLAALGFRGVNVTIPHKQAVMPYLDVLDEAAQVIGAVNTVVVERLRDGETGRLGDWEIGGAASSDWRLVGYNTDWSGFAADLQGHGIAIAGRDSLVLGAGGSARAVVYALARMGGRVQVLARRPEQALALIADLQARFPGQLSAASLAALAQATAATKAPLIVNTTPLGMEPRVDTSPWPDDVPFPAGAFVYDLVYKPLQTRLMQKATTAGCRATNGLGMLALQAAQAFSLWTGMKANVVERFSQIAQALQERS